MTNVSYELPNNFFLKFLLKICLAKYDITILAPYLFGALRERYGSVSVLKKGNAYFSITTPIFVFKDALLFTSPCSLSKYLKQNDVKEEKSLFPYSFFHTIEEMRAYTEFPSKSAFYSELKNCDVSDEDYIKAKSEFYRRKALPVSDPEKMNCMADWLAHYNELDTGPLAHAIDNSFKNFFSIFGIDPSFCVSLPKYAQFCMFRSYSESEPLCYSYFKKQTELREFTRENLTGGLVNVFHRCIDLSGRQGLPRSAQYAPNGKKFSALSFFDFNSLYLYAQLMEFPATPGNEIFLLMHARVRFSLCSRFQPVRLSAGC